MARSISRFPISGKRKIISKSSKNKKLNYIKKAEFIRKFQNLPFSNTKNFNRFQKSLITKKYNDLKRFSGASRIKITKAQERRFSAAGFKTTTKNKVRFVLIRRSAKGSKIWITKQGFSEKIGDRSARTRLLSKSDKRKLLLDPETWISNNIPTSTGDRIVLTFPGGQGNIEYEDKELLTKYITDFIADTIPDDDEKPSKRAISFKKSLSGVTVISHRKPPKKKKKKKKKRRKKS